MRQGSLLWLVRNDLRIEWRELTAQWSTGLAVTVGLAVVSIITYVWLLVLGNFRPLFEPPVAAELNILTGVLVLGLLPVAVMLGMNHSIKAVFERNDLDLLLTSPVPTRTVFTSRLLGVASYLFLALGLFLLPLGIAGLIMSIPRLLGIVPVLLALGLSGAAVGMLLTLLLVRLIGARRARTFAQIVAALTGAIVILAMQLPAVLGDNQISNVTMQRIIGWFQPGGILAVDSPLWVPGRTLLADPVATVLTVGAALALFLLASVTLHRWFQLGVSSAVTVSGRRKRVSADQLRFDPSGSLWRTMLRKEWRLLIRDTFLASQTLLQVVYMIPLGFILFFNRDGSVGVDLGPALAAVLTLLAGTLASSLARIVMAGEEAMELLVASPVPARQLRQAKFIAALLPVWLLSTPLLFGLFLYEPDAGLLAALGVVVTTVCAGFIRLKNPSRARRQDLFKRQGQGDQLLAFFDGMLPLAWGGTVWLLLAGSTWWLLTLGIGVVLLMFAWQRGAALGVDYAGMTRE